MAQKPEPRRVTFVFTTAGEFRQGVEELAARRLSAPTTQPKKHANYAAGFNDGVRHVFDLLEMSNVEMRFRK